MFENLLHLAVLLDSFLVCAARGVKQFGFHLFADHCICFNFCFGILNSLLCLGGGGCLFVFFF